MKKIEKIALLLTICLAGGLVAQMKFTDDKTDKTLTQGAVVEFTSKNKNKGVKMPVVTLTDVNTYTLDGLSLSPYAEGKGTVVFHLGGETGVLANKGVFIWNGSQWTQSPVWDKSGSDIEYNTGNVSTTGSLTASNFIQTENPVFVKVTGSGTQNVNNNANTLLQFNTVVVDNGGWYNPSNYTFTAPVNGIYAAYANVRFNPDQLNPATYLRCFISIDNSNFNGNSQNLETIQGVNNAAAAVWDLSSQYVSLTPGGIMKLNQGQTLSVRGGMNSGNASVTFIWNWSTFTVALIRELP